MISTWIILLCVAFNVYMYISSNSIYTICHNVPLDNRRSTDIHLLIHLRNKALRAVLRKFLSFNFFARSFHSYKSNALKRYVSCIRLQMADLCTYVLT